MFRNYGNKAYESDTQAEPEAGGFMMRKTFFAALAAVWVSVGVLTAAPAQAVNDGYGHHVVFHVDENDAATMNLALNNAANVVKHYAGQGERVQIEIVAYGPGLHMLRADTSPVKDRLATYMPSFPDVTFAACGNTLEGMAKTEGKVPELIQSDAIATVPSGVVQIMVRQDQGWNYIRP
jgi:hypothetical protein